MTSTLIVGSGIAIDNSNCQGSGTVNANSGYYVNSTQVVGPRITTWEAPTGTATRTTFATSTVTLEQLAQRVKALIDDLFTHGLLG